MASSSQSESFIAGQSMMYITFTLVVQTFFFGGYTVLILISTRMHLQQGMKKRSIKVLFSIGLFMYTLSAAFWAYSVADVIGRMQAYIDPGNPQWASFFNRVSKPFNLFNALVLMNFVLSDGIVIWRGWAICSRNHRKFLAIPITLLCITVVTTAALIVIKTADIIVLDKLNPPWFAEVVNILQVTNMATSLMSNISATSLIGVTAWRHRQTIQAAFRERSKANQILMLLVESGMLYCVAALIGMAALVIRLPKGTLNDIYLPANVQLAGAYAPAVLLLVGSHKSSDDTEILGTVNVSTARRNSARAHRASRGARTVLSMIEFEANHDAESSRSSGEVDVDSEMWRISMPQHLVFGRQGTDPEMGFGSLDAEFKEAKIGKL